MLLRRVPLFAGFAEHEFERIAERFTEVGFRRGGVVCRAGEAGEHFYVVAAGELDVWADEPGGRLLHHLGPGDFLGEMSLLLDWRRTATVTASRPTRLLALSRQDFERLVLRSAPALEALSRELARRLASRTRGRTPRRTPTIGVTSGPGLRGATLVASGIAALLRELGRRPVLRIALQRPEQQRRLGGEPVELGKVALESTEQVRARLVSDRPEPARLELAVRGESDEPHALRTLIERLRDRFAHVVLDFGPLGSSVTDLCDRLVRIDADDRGPGADERATQALHVVNLANEISQPLALNHCEPFVIPFDRALADLDAEAQGRYLVDHSETPAAVPLYRLTRKLLGRSLGIALGGGAAFGVAHIGVLQVLESDGISVDLLAGTSMGSVIALAYAAGTSPAELARQVERIGRLRTLVSALDFTITRPGLLAGERIRRLLAPLLGDCRDFSELLRPCRAVACDIESGERVQIKSGRLDAAFGASCAVPVVWAPVVRDGRVLVDGGMNDPVPAGVVHEMGADVCLAVNVVPAPRRDVPSALTRIGRGLRRLSPLHRLAGTSELPNTFDIVMNSLQTLQHELGNFKAISADVRINTDLADFTWTDFQRSPELIARGAAAAERALPQIRRTLAEREGAAQAG